MFLGLMAIDLKAVIPPFVSTLVINRWTFRNRTMPLRPHSFAGRVCKVSNRESILTWMLLLIKRHGRGISRGGPCSRNSCGKEGGRRVCQQILENLSGRKDYWGLKWNLDRCSPNKVAGRMGSSERRNGSKTGATWKQGLQFHA